MQLLKNKNIFIINKKIGQTPVSVLDDFKRNNLLYKEKKMTYAGRLDPMAEGKLLILVGDKCKEKEKYLNLDKEYEFEILLGLKSDSKDLLGIAKKDLHQYFNFSEIQKKLERFVGEREMEYPVFSSKTVKGKPLF